MSDPFLEKPLGDASPLNMATLSGLPLVGRFFKTGPKIPVIRLSGVIADATMRRGGLSYARLSKLIDKAFSIPKVPVVALVINSPGGAAAQSQLIAGLIRQKAEEKAITVTAFVEDVAASGGYWLACAADDIYVQETSIVGSVGVIFSGFGFEDFIGKHGIKRRLYTAGQDKSMLDPFLPERPGDVARLKEIQSQIHTHFIDWVKERRGGRLNGLDEELFEGRFWAGSAALEMGLVDGVGSVHSLLREKYGDDVRFIELTPDKKRFFPLPLVRADAAHDLREGLAEDVLATVENRAVWSRFGL